MSASPLDGDAISERISARTGRRPEDIEQLPGGEIGRVFRIETDAEPLAAKTGPTPLEVEAAMLRYLWAETPLPVPDVRFADPDLLVMSFVAGDGGVTTSVERHAAEAVAALHGRSAAAAGFRFDTLSGPLPQPNPWTGSWIRFFGTHRLAHVAARAREAGELPSDLAPRVRTLRADLDEWLVEPRRMALLHGDIWTDNLVIRDGRVAAFLDPAISFGHPELDLAYVRWTDTFGEPFFERYRARRGLAPGFETRYPVYTVLFLLEHAYCFGAPYPARLRETLDELGY